MGPGRRCAGPHGDLRSGDDAGPGPAGERTGGLTTTANAGGSPGVVRRRWRRSCRCCICGGCRRADFRGALPVLLGKDAAGPESDEHLAADGGRGREVLGRSGSGTCRRAAASTGGWTGSIDGPYRPARGRVARTAAAGGVPRSRSARSAWGPGPPRGGAGWQVMECRRLYSGRWRWRPSVRSAGHRSGGRRGRRTCGWSGRRACRRACRGSSRVRRATRCRHGCSGAGTVAPGGAAAVDDLAGVW